MSDGKSSELANSPAGGRDGSQNTGADRRPTDGRVGDGGSANPAGMVASALAYGVTEPGTHIYIGEVIDCPATSVTDERCVCKPLWGHRSFAVNASPLRERVAELERRDSERDAEELEDAKRADSQILALREERDSLAGKLQKTAQEALHLTLANEHLVEERDRLRSNLINLVGLMRPPKHTPISMPALKDARASLSPDSQDGKKGGE